MAECVIELATCKASYLPGEGITVTYSLGEKSPNEGDWIAVFPTAEAEEKDTSDTWVLVSDSEEKSTVKLTAPTTAGSFILKYMQSAEGASASIKTVTFQVEEGSGDSASSVERSAEDVAKIEKLTEQNQKLTVQLKEFSQHLDTLKERMNQKEQELQAAVDEAQNSENSCVLDAKLKNAHKRIDMYKKSNQKLQSQLLQQAEYEVSIKIADELTDKTRECKQIGQENKMLSQEIERLKNALVSKGEENQNAPDALKKMEMERNRALEQNKNYKKKIDQQECQAKKVQDHMIRLEKKNRKLQEKINSRGLKKGEVFQPEEIHLRKIAALERQIEGLKQDIMEKNAEIRLYCGSAPTGNNKNGRRRKKGTSRGSLDALALTPMAATQKKPPNPEDSYAEDFS